MENIITEGRSRRDFLKGAGAVVAGGVVIGVIGSQLSCEGIPGLGPVAEAKGYILVDTNECTGCKTCMTACSMAHEGKTSLALSRTQVIQDNMGKFPGDIHQEQCRQCVYVPCWDACPVDAWFTDRDNGNVRTIDAVKCKSYQDTQANGCRQCMEACPHEPSSVIWNNVRGVATICDLCADTPFWDEEGGVNGKQICVQVCPAVARRFTSETPDQLGNGGYQLDFYDEPSYRRGHHQPGDPGIPLPPE